jgi:hypothetical protein
MDKKRLSATLAKVEAELSVAQKELKRRESQLSGALPGGWEEVLDAESGEPYYHHVATGLTTWERPGAMDAVSGQPEPPACRSGASGGSSAPDPMSMWSSMGLPAQQAQTSKSELDAIMGSTAAHATHGETPPSRERRTLPDACIEDWTVGRLSVAAAAVEAGDFERAIELRDTLRLSSGMMKPTQSMSMSGLL